MIKTLSFFSFLFFVFFAQPALAQKRIALVIGNAAYSGKLGKLDNPLNDIALVSKSLRAVGFEVMEPVQNADRAQLLLAIYDFAAKLKAAGRDSVGFLYYAGHGIAAGGANYLIPVNVKSLKARVLNVAGVRLAEITALLRDNAPDADHFVVFDACRNRLRGARGKRGFIPEQGRPGMFIAFSSAPDQTAEDGDGQNGPYAMALAAELQKPRQDHLHLFQNVKESVIASTGTQVPWERNGLRKRLYFGNKGAGQSVTPKAPRQKKQLTTRGFALDSWERIKNTDDPELLEGFIKHFKGTFYAVLARKRLKKLTEKKVAIGVFPKKQPQRTRLVYEPEVVHIPGGTFSMGCVSGKGCQDDEKPVHKVTVGSFYLSKYETTWAQWDACVKDGGCDNGPVKKAGGDNGWGKGNRPVIEVSWYDAVQYAKWLSRKTGQTWRLPTEAEWEYAARGDENGRNKTRYSWGNSIGRNKANCYGEQCGDKWKNTSPVGSFSANKFGLHDMHGNVWEWVHDWYGDYKKGSQTDPKGPSTGSYRVLRGGSWYGNAGDLRSAYRNSYSPGRRSNNLGFRLLRQVSDTTTQASSNTCVTIGRKIPSPIKLIVGARFCDAARKNKARVIKIANRAVVFLDNGVKKTCAQGALCAFDWPVKPLFRIKARADKAKGIAPQATMEPRR